VSAAEDLTEDNQEDVEDGEYYKGDLGADFHGPLPVCL